MQLKDSKNSYILQCQELTEQSIKGIMRLEKASKNQKHSTNRFSGTLCLSN